jgi:hypothetical protein
VLILICYSIEMQNGPSSEKHSNDILVGSGALVEMFNPWFSHATSRNLN